MAGVAGGGNSTHPIILIIQAVDKFAGPMKNIAARIGKLGKGLGNVGEAAKTVAGRFAALTGAVGLSAGGVAAAIHELMNSGDQLAEIADRVGIGVDAFASLRYAAEQADVSQESFNTAMDFFSKSLGQAKANGGPLLEFLNKVSPKLAEQVKNAKNVEAAMSLMTDAFAAIKDPQKRAALATATFGRAGQQMGAFLHQGSAAIQSQQAEFLKLAGSQEAFAKSSGELDNASRRTKTALMGVATTAAGLLFPALVKIADAVTGIVSSHRADIEAWATTAAKAINDWIAGGGIQEVVKWFEKVGKGIGVVVDFLGGFRNTAIAVGLVMAGPLLASIVGLVGPIVGLIVPAISGLITVIGALGTAWTAVSAIFAVFGIGMAPVIAVIAALAAGAYLIIKNWDAVKSFFSDLFAWLKDRFFALNEFLAKIPGFGGAGFINNFFSQPAAAASFSASAASLPASSSSQSTQANVSIDFKNMPRGVQVSQDPNSSQQADLNVGPLMSGSF